MNVLQQKVGIWYKDEAWRDRIFEEILSNIPKDSIRILGNKQSEHYRRIELKDGSTIKMIPATEFSRGYAVTRAFIQDGIPYDIYSNIIRPCTKPIFFDSVVVNEIEDFYMGRIADKHYWISVVDKI